MTDRDALILEYLPKVKSIALRLKQSRLHTADLDELIAVGNLELVKAAGRYKGTNDCSFSTYAYECIVGAMMKSFISPDGHKKWYQQTWLPITPQEFIRPSTDPSPQAVIEEEETRERLHGAIDLLRYKQRRVMKVLIDEDVPMSEVAKTLGCSYFKAYSSYRTGVKNLRELLAA